MYIVVKSAMYIHKLKFTFNSPDSIVYSHTYMLVLLARLSQGRGESILSSSRKLHFYCKHSVLCIG